jgi:hypothetical protein
MYFRQNLWGIKEGEAINGEVGEALSSNNDKKETLKGRLKEACGQGHRYHEGLKVITDKDVGEEVNKHKNQEYKYHKGWS